MTTTPRETESPAPVEPEEEMSAPSPADAEVLAGSLGEYVSSWVKRARSGESGMLPVVVGLVVIVVIFQFQNSNFLTGGNLTNLLSQDAAVYVLLGMAEVFVLLLGEIDLSAGFVGAIGGFFTVWLSSDKGWPWGAAVLVGLLVPAAIGAVMGLIIVKLRVPSFVVTLAGLLGFQGVLLALIDNLGGKSSGGTIPISNPVIGGLVNNSMPIPLAWVVTVIAVALFALILITRDLRRSGAGLAAPPLGLTIAKIVAVAVAGVLLVLVCSVNRGVGFGVVNGVPWAVPIMLAIVMIWSLLLSKTRFGRYVYAIGGNAEAARRAGINLSRIRVACFALCSMTAGAAGIIYASRLGSISNNIPGGQLVLYAVAAAVIGGTSLFGGRGKVLHALLGGIVIATIDNGMGLINLSAASKYMVTALVLLAAVTVDA
ncbi:MAG: ABC transporter permease, partial [Actinomycetota bacterium]|nr:ABC transporter permease [Actinomycetota bacterium]